MKQLKKQEIKKIFKEFPKRKQEIYLVLENIQYAKNVANIFRTADAAGVRRIYLTGISQQPPFGKELRKASRNKEQSVEWMYKETTGEVINTLKKQGFKVIAIELTDESINLSKLSDSLKDEKKVCFIAGSEVFGVTKTTLEKCDKSVVIPMYGKGASLNVSTSVGIVLYSF
jgi:23S rRNA (guanosine2251-2'-O)-methyltransferase